MILSGKDLVKYRVNQIKKFALMFATVFGTVVFMMLMCIVCG